MKIFVGIPCQHGFSVQFNAALVNLMRNATVKAEVEICQSPGVGISRNILTANFLNSDCDKLLMLDSDILFTVQDVERISSHDVPLVGGMYSKKEKQGRMCCERLPYGESVPNKRGLVPLKYIGTGFMCIKRELIEQMVRYCLDIKYIDERTKKNMHDFWTVGVHRPTKRYLTEDWWFCQRTHDLGYPVYGDSEVILQHEGRAIYPLELNEEA